MPTTISHPQLHRLCTFYDENSLFVATEGGIDLFNFKDLSLKRCVPMRPVHSFDFSAKRQLLSGVHSGQTVFLCSLDGRNLLGSRRLFNIGNTVGRVSLVELDRPMLLASGNAPYCGLYDLDKFAEDRLGPIALVNNHEFDAEGRRLLFALEDREGAPFRIADIRSPHLEGISFGERGVHGAAIVAAGGHRVVASTVHLQLQIWDARQTASPVHALRAAAEMYSLIYRERGQRLFFGQSEKLFGVIDLSQPAWSLQLDYASAVIGGCALSESGATMAVTLPIAAVPRLLLYDA